MKYKTLCRLLVKLIGIFVIATGIASAGMTLASTIMSIVLQEGNTSWHRLLWPLPYLLGYGVTGLATYMKSDWITNKLIPSNRRYCHECAYDLTGTIGCVCPECGTEFRRAPVDQEPHH